MPERKIKKTCFLLSLLLCLPTVFSVPVSAAEQDGFMTETAYDVSALTYAAPASQGEDNRYVLYGDIREYYAMEQGTVGAVSKYTALRTNNFVYDRHEFCPDADNALLMWQAPHNGTVRFSGKVYNRYAYADHDATTRDGVRISVYRKSSASDAPQTLYSQAFDDDFAIYIDRESVYEVRSGEMFFIEVNQIIDGAWDTTGICFGAEFTENADDPGAQAGLDQTGIAEQTDWMASYSDVQGADGWFYAYGSPKRYKLMEYGPTDLVPAPHWYGPEDYQDIYADYMNAGSRAGVLRIWVAESDGTVALDGTVVKVLGGGDGATAQILKNEEVLFSHDFSAATGQAVLPDSLEELEVKQGDTIVFYLSSGQYCNNGWDGVSFRCVVRWERQGTDRLANDALLACLGNLAGNDAELYGVTIVGQDGYDLQFSSGKPPSKQNAALYIGISVAVLAAAGIAVAAVLIHRKKERKK